MNRNKQTSENECSGSRLKAQMRVYYGTAKQLLLSNYTCNSKDLSHGGLYLQTETPLTKGENLLLRFTLPGQSKAITCKARIAWVNLKENPLKPELSPGVGVEFVDLATQSLKEIQSFLLQHDIEPAW